MKLKNLRPVLGAMIVRLRGRGGKGGDCACDGLGRLPVASHPVKTEVVLLLTEVIPWAKMVRFGNSGPDSTSAAPSYGERQ